jgi:hypothetical protein
MEQAGCTSIKDHFTALCDPRILLKTRHKLVDIVIITLCTVIAGANDWVEIAAFGKEKEQWFTLLGTEMGYFQVTFPGPGDNIERLQMPEKRLLVTPAVEGAVERKATEGTCSGA